MQELDLSWKINCQEKKTFIHNSAHFVNSRSQAKNTKQTTWKENSAITNSASQQLC